MATCGLFDLVKKQNAKTFFRNFLSIPGSLLKNVNKKLQMF